MNLTWIACHSSLDTPIAGNWTRAAVKISPARARGKTAWYSLPMEKKRLLILGGGFAGLDVARSIGKSRAAREYWATLLIDKENFFQFNPLLPAVAVGSVETRHIVYPFRDAARHRHLRFVKNKVTGID